MHIGFDISQTGTGKAGCGHFAQAMIETMLALAPDHRYALYPSFGDFFLDPRMPAACAFAGRNVQYGPRHATLDAAQAFWNQPALEEALGHPDIIHANNFWCPVSLRSGRLVYTLYDLSFTVDPDWTTEANRLGCFDGVFRAAVAADWIVAISEASRRDFLRNFPAFPEERVRVVYPCSRFSGAQGSAGTRPRALPALAPGGFWLSVGTIEPRKNQRRLADAYARYRALAGPDAALPLVLAGGSGWLMDDFQQHLAELGIAADVSMTGYVSDQELIWLYRNCYANLYPSLYEGFGLPVLEGMQFGAPTVTSNASSLPEVAGSAALLLDPLDTEAWAACMQALAADRAERDRLAAAALVQARRFDRTASARELLALYEEVAAAPRRS
jgi:glycosyltransferase involved in cell wall biosynthesis